MLLDITLQVTQSMLDTAWSNTAQSLTGHLGTHFDVMDKEFPLSYTRCPGVVFDVSALREREILPEDIDLTQVKPGMFVAFYTGYIDAVAYGTLTYFREHPQLSDGLIDALLDKGIAIIGIDCAGIRRTPDHVPTDRRCAQRDVFVVENLCHLNKLLALSPTFTAYTFPLSVAGITGLPCRVVAEV